MIKKIAFISLGVLAFATFSQAETATKATAKKASSKGNYYVKATKVTAPDVTALWKQFHESTAQLAKTSPIANRKVASDSKSRITGSQDLMSKPLVDFRNKLIAVKDAETLNALLTEYNTNYDNAEAAYPNDLKYVIARLSPLLSMRGFFWRMAPLAHQAAITQETLLSMVRSFAEQVMIYEPDTQWPAYIAFLAIPTKDLLTPPTADPNDTVKTRKDKSFTVENDLPDFLAREVYPALQTACNRLGDLKMSIQIDGKESPIIFDNQIRFGQNAFSNFQFDATDRFKIVGDAERYAGIARFSRRMAMIAQLSAYNWNGNIALREAIGKKMGIDSAQSTVMGGLTNIFGGGGGTNAAFTMEGITREERVIISKGYPNVFSLRNKNWMPVAYYNLHNYAYFSQLAWEKIRDESDDYNFLLDPDLSAGRRDQIDKSVRNLASLLPDPKVGGPAPVAQGSITGKTVHVDMKKFFNDPPTNLHYLMPTGFAHHEDLAGLEKVYTDFSAAKNDSVVKMSIDGHPAEWRNYLYGRATSWDLSGNSKYAALFPDSKSGTDVADAQKVLSETRGGRPLLNTLVIFIK